MTMWADMTPGARLRVLRKQREWTQLELAFYAGVCLRTVQAAERDPETLRVYTLGLILDALEAPRAAPWLDAQPSACRGVHAE